MSKVAQTGLHAKAAIDAIAAVFYDAFTNCDGRVPNVEGLHHLFIAEAIIIKNVDEKPIVWNLVDFIEPRKKMLASGVLTEFREREVSEITHVYGQIAQRFSTYEKSWKSAGTRHEGRGAKTLQFVKTDSGWRISALAWDDEEPES